MTELMVGTKKGLFVLEGEPGQPFAMTARAFAGEPVEYAIRDPRSERVLASVTSPFYGPKVFTTDDPALKAKLDEISTAIANSLVVELQSAAAQSASRARRSRPSSLPYQSDTCAACTVRSGFA